MGCEQRTPNQILNLVERIPEGGDIEAAIDSLSRTELKMLYHYLKEYKYDSSKWAMVQVRYVGGLKSRISIILGEYDFDEALKGVLQIDRMNSGAAMICYHFKAYYGKTFDFCPDPYIGAILDEGRFRLWVKYDASGRPQVNNAEKLKAWE